MSDIEGKVTRVGARAPAASEFQIVEAWKQPFNSSPKSRMISVRQRRNRKFAIARCYSPTRVGAHSQAQDKLTALPDRRLIRSLSAFSLAKEDQVNENA